MKATQSRIRTKTKPENMAANSAHSRVRPSPRTKEIATLELEEEFLRAAKYGDTHRLKECIELGVDVKATNQGGLNAVHLASREGYPDIVQDMINRGVNVQDTTKKKNTALHIASLGGHLKVVEILLRCGASVNVTAENDFTPLYMAAQENHSEIVKLLLNHKADPHMTSKGFEPLDVAIQQGHADTVKVLLEHGAKRGLHALHVAAKKDNKGAASLLLQKGVSANTTAPNGYTPLHIAAKYGSLNTAHQLIEAGGDVNISAKSKVHPLHVAAKFGQTGLVALLIEAGADLHVETKDGLTPLHCAARDGHEHAVELLLVHGSPITAKTRHGLSALHMAAQGNNVSCANHLLGHGAHIDAVTTEGMTPLHVAAHYGHLAMAQLLLDRGADIDKQAKNGYTPLHVACKKNREPVVQLLLRCKASVHLQNRHGQTALHVATYFGNVNVVLLLIQSGASIEVVTYREETVLHIACRTKQITIVRLLLRNNAKVNPKSKVEDTPLHVACRQGSPEIVSLLLDNGANPDVINKEACTPLHIGARIGNERIVESLLDHKADVNIVSKRGFTPLHEACKGGYTPIVEALIEKGAVVNAEGKNNLTPLHIACHYSRPDIALLLLEKNANPQASARNGFTPLHIAAKKNQVEIICLLLDRGVEPDKTTRTGVSPLHLCAQEGNEKITDILLEHGASPGIQTKNGLTPLHVAVRYKQIDVVRKLIKYGAPINAHSASGFTPLHLAAFYGYLDIAEFLLEEGADVEAKTKNGNTPLHLAAVKGHKDVVELLLKHNAPPNALNRDGYTALYIAEITEQQWVIETLVRVTQVIVRPKEKPPSSEQIQQAFAAPEDLEDSLLIDTIEEDQLPEVPKQAVHEDFQESFLGFDESASTYGTTPEPAMESPVHAATDISSIDLQDVPPDNISFYEPPKMGGFLISFLVDARGGTLESRQSGIKITIPRKACRMPTRVTCRLCRNRRKMQLPPLQDNEAVVSRILELSPQGSQFLRPITIEIPHYASLRGKERELVILRSDVNSSNWREHVSSRLDSDINEEDTITDHVSSSPDHGINGGVHFVRLVTQDFPEKFVIISRPRREKFLMFREGGLLKSSVNPGVQVNFPDGAVNMGTRLILQIQPTDATLVPQDKVFYTSHIVGLYPPSKLQKPITISVPCDRSTFETIYGRSSKLRLVAWLPKEEGKELRDNMEGRWTDITQMMALTVVGDVATFTTKDLTRYCLIESDAFDSDQAGTLITKLSAVPYSVKLAVYGRLLTMHTAELRVFCMTDDKVNKTLENREGLTEIARSREIELYNEQTIYINCTGNLISSKNQKLKIRFKPFQENRLSFKVSSFDSHAPLTCRLSFIRSFKRDHRGKVGVLCSLDVALTERMLRTTSRDIVYQVSDDILQFIARSMPDSWMVLAEELGMNEADVQGIVDISGGSSELAALTMLELWRSKDPGRASYEVLRDALERTGHLELARDVELRSPSTLSPSGSEQSFRMLGRDDLSLNEEPLASPDQSVTDSPPPDESCLKAFSSETITEEEAKQSNDFIDSLLDNLRTLPLDQDHSKDVHSPTPEMDMHASFSMHSAHSPVSEAVPQIENTTDKANVNGCDASEHTIAEEEEEPNTPCKENQTFEDAYAEPPTVTESLDDAISALDNLDTVAQSSCNTQISTDYSTEGELKGKRPVGNGDVMSSDFNKNVTVKENNDEQGDDFIKSMFAHDKSVLEFFDENDGRTVNES